MRTMMSDEGGFETKGERRLEHDEVYPAAERSVAIGGDIGSEPDIGSIAADDESAFDLREQTEELAEQADEVAERAHELADRVAGDERDEEDGFPTERES
jgi:hypothetical protein